MAAMEEVRGVEPVEAVEEEEEEEVVVVVVVVVVEEEEEEEKISIWNDCGSCAHQSGS